MSETEAETMSETMSETVAGKPIMVIGIDESEHSFYALEWILDQFFTPFVPNYPFKLFIVHAKPSPSRTIGLGGPAMAEVLSQMEADYKATATRVLEKAKEMCITRSVDDVEVESMDGDARTVMCDAVKTQNATILVVGSHGYGVIKRALLGSVSDYCAHHAQCSVMIVKQPKKKKTDSDA